MKYPNNFDVRSLKMYNVRILYIRRYSHIKPPGLVEWYNNHLNYVNKIKMCLLLWVFIKLYIWKCKHSWIRVRSYIQLPVFSWERMGNFFFASPLSDRKVFLSKGKLKCAGSSLFLKKKWGIGYHLRYSHLRSLGERDMG